MRFYPLPGLLGIQSFGEICVSKINFLPTLSQETLISSLDHTQQKRSCEDKRGLIEKYSSEKGIG